jgi:hypothetical protein
MSTATIRIRRSAGELHALAGVQREIRATDSHARCKYVREFTDAFRSYQSVLEPEELHRRLLQSDVLLVGDYHALAACQRYTAELVEILAGSANRPIVLMLETVLARDQNILEEWLHGDVDERELRHRLRFDRDWGYEWEPFYELLTAARRHCAGVYGLDCLPRNDLRRIGMRDRHAAEKVAEARRRHPKALLISLSGESHLAPDHLPRRVRELLPEERVLTLLQNVDALYFRATGEPGDPPAAVCVSDDVVCVFNSTPLEKYESYRLNLERWKVEDASEPDLSPTIYNLIHGLGRFLHIDSYSSHNGTQPRFLVDQLPRVCYPAPDDEIRALLSCKGPEKEVDVSTCRNWESWRFAGWKLRMQPRKRRAFCIASAAEQPKQRLAPRVIRQISSSPLCWNRRWHILDRACFIRFALCWNRRARTVRRVHCSPISWSGTRSSTLAGASGVRKPQPAICRGTEAANLSAAISAIISDARCTTPT